MKFAVTVLWRSFDEQGREFRDSEWKPNKSYEIVYTNSAMITEDEIKEFVRHKYEPYRLIEINGIQVTEIYENS